MAGEAQLRWVSRAKQSIKDDGVRRAHHEIRGEQFVTFFQTYLPKDPRGLDFVYRVSKGDEEVWLLITAFVERPIMGLVRVFSAGTLSREHAYFFHQEASIDENDNLRVAPQEEPVAVILQLWIPGSEFIHYYRSHKQFNDAGEDEKYGLFAKLRSEMGIESSLLKMDYGGFTIIDSRVGWTIISGTVLNIGFGTDAEVEEWGKIYLPDTPAHRTKVEELHRKGLRTNYAFETQQVHEGRT